MALYSLNLPPPWKRLSLDNFGTGFYHDPQAGWYYSCNDGLYYKFESGTYVLIEFSKDGCGEINSCQSISPIECSKDEVDVDINMLGENVSQVVEPLSTKFSEDHLEDTNYKLPENPPPPSLCLSLITTDEKVPFVVLGNLFCTEYANHRHFELKGSSYGRLTEKSESQI
ncbi:hypothetical protein FXO38_15429 [Capsicum annuum]|uniref:Uncharacterized protein n=1 Tax=Capsicum annuum TaxID=4072 RepID=A0A2G2YET8_CAPAN|nr:hypothetical protein FXO37_32860 [Capsicum annuum]KAF3653917.1 hypothetical protein FXO38_15429 [Capsicum annuum]PHT68257.1 hypothetical protein T459_27744 [Capsicum annuum]